MIYIGQEERIEVERFIRGVLPSLGVAGEIFVPLPPDDMGNDQGSLTFKLVGSANRRPLVYECTTPIEMDGVPGQTWRIRV